MDKSEGRLSVVVLSGEESGCDNLSVKAIVDDFELAARCQKRRLQSSAPPNKNSPHYQPPYLNHGHVFEVRREAMSDVADDGIDDADIIVVPGGELWGNRGKNYTDTLGKEGQKVLADAVHRGAVYVGICAGAFLACQISGLGRGKVRFTRPDIFGCASEGPLSGDVALKSVSERGIPEDLQTAVKPMIPKVAYYDGPMFEVIPGSGASILAKYGEPVGTTSKLASQWDELGSMMKGAAAVVAFRAGRGAVILVSPHPELTKDAVASEKVLPSLATAAREWAGRGDELAKLGCYQAGVTKDTEWACARCTLWNSCSRETCQACGWAPGKTVKDWWTCTRCTYDNPRQAQVCKMCGLEKFAAVEEEAPAKRRRKETLGELRRIDPRSGY